jgi:predicted transcriptional regulator
MNPGEFEQMVAYLKVLANENRMRIIGILAEGEASVGEIAELLSLRESTVSEHLSMLRSVDLVTFRAEGNNRIYAFNPRAMHRLNQQLFDREKLAEIGEQVTDKAEVRVLRTFLDGERLTQLPTGMRRWLIVLKWLAGKFEDGRSYSEQEVNAILGRHHDDYATLRRNLVDMHFMAREKGVYWRLPRERWGTDYTGRPLIAADVRA